MDDFRKNILKITYGSCGCDDCFRTILKKKDRRRARHKLKQQDKIEQNKYRLDQCYADII